MIGNGSLGRRCGRLAAAVIVGGVVTTGTASADQCARSSEQRAIDARMLQTELMVAALSCQNKTDYNDFVTKFRPQLVKEGRSLRRMFQRMHGGSAKRQMNAMVTRLANEASQRSMAAPSGFCQKASALFAEARTIDVSQFDILLAKGAAIGGSGIRPCGGPVMYGTANGPSTPR